MSAHPPINNVFIDCTIQNLVQIDALIGDFLHQPPSLPEEPLDLAARKLAESVFRQWREEANTWDVVKPTSMRVRWQASWPDADHPYKVGGEVAGSGDRIGTIAEAYLALRQRRLVMLGGPGAGKTTLAVLLALDLLFRRLNGGDRGPVPVILRLETWDAERVHLHTWLTRQIMEDHRGLPSVDGRHPAARLVSDRRVLPVLDGLDELPEHRRISVVSELNRALADGDPLILTSRPGEYRDTIARAGTISSAAVVEALPVKGEDAVAYLTDETSPAHLDRWDPVFEELRESPPKPVALVLSSPLMLWLARRVYALPPADPADLVDTGRLPTRASIEEHLLDRIVPTVFTQAPPAPDRLHAPGMWNPDRARHWLNSLAGHLTRHRTSELAWWRLHRDRFVLAVAVPALVAVCALLAWAAERLATWLVDGPWSGPGTTHPGPRLAFGTALTLAGMLLAIQRFWFRRNDGQPRRLANPFRLGAALRSASRAVSVGRTLRAASMVVVPAAAFSAFALVTPYPVPFLVTALCSAVLAPLLLAAISAPADTQDAGSPDELLRDERRALVLSLCTIAPLIGLSQGTIDWFAPAASRAPVASALLGWLGAAVILAGFSPWTRWFLAKAVMAATGRIPWSLMEFLADAHRHGLMQRGGGVYRFRNQRLQEHFAGRRGQPSSPGVPAPREPHAEIPPARPAPRVEDLSSNAPRPRPRIKRPDSPRQVIADTERTPLRERPKWTVHEDEHSFRAGGRHRGFPVGHWNSVALVSTLMFVIYAVDGSWRTGLRWVEFWIVVGVVVMPAVYLLKPLVLDFRLTPEYLGYKVNRRSGVVPWRDISGVQVDKFSLRGWKGSVYGVVITLHPGVPEPHRTLRTADGRFLVLPLMSLTDSVPMDLDAALIRFAGALWRPPTPELRGPDAERGAS